MTPESQSAMLLATDVGQMQPHPPTALTGCDSLLERFEAASLIAQREGERLAILLLDLDTFTHLHDDPGHRPGEAARRHVARCLDASVRVSDTVSLHGDDEFVILLTGLALPADAASVAENMLSNLVTPEGIGEHAVNVSASMGISIYPDDARGLEELIRLAHGAKCLARHRGPGRYAFHSSAEPPRIQRLAPAMARGFIRPRPASLVMDHLRQGRMQEANERLLLALMSAQQLQNNAEHALGDQNALLARVAHELRNPLTPISVAASLMDAAHVDELPKLRSLIERQVDHLSRVVGDLLDLSRSKAGKLRLQWSEVDLACILAESIDACGPAIQSRRQRLVVDTPGHSLRVEGDRVRLVQMISNLLDNASKYTPAEGVITVAAYESGTDVVVSVSDSGIGIHPDAIAAVFQPFTQEANATRFNGTGLGIGLTVVRELAEAHGGKIEAFSAGEGQGSQFVLTLPQNAHEGSGHLR